MCKGFALMNTDLSHFEVPCPQYSAQSKITLILESSTARALAI